MALTLNQQMDAVFHHGLTVAKMYQQPIEKEWEEILLHLQQTGEKPTKNMDSTVRFFTTYLFHREVEPNDTNKNSDDTSNPKHHVSIQTNQFFITLLENAVHKVMQACSDHTHQDHQAIQYLFSSISEQILTQPYQQFFTLETFLNNLVSSNQLPIEWAAIVIKKDQSYQVETAFNRLDQNLFLENEPLQSDTIHSMSELLLKQMTNENETKYNVFPIPHEDVTLFVCVTQEDNSHVIPFITYALEIFQNGKETLKVANPEHQWKDSVILFNETIMRSTTFHEAAENIAAGFVNYLPFERCALFSYSMNDQMGFGLFGHHLDNQVIQNITEDIENLPIIQNNLQILQLFGKSMNYLQPIYIADAKAGFPEQYVQQFQLGSVVIAPIFTSSSNRLLGAAILDQGPDTYFKVAQETFTALIKFGQSSGEMLAKYNTGYIENQTDMPHFSPRELEVLKLMARGDSTMEAADSLYLSEYTVRDYVSAIIKKMDARNRTEAVARAIRDGFI